MRNGDVSYRDAVEDRPELDGMAVGALKRASEELDAGVDPRSAVEALVTAAPGDMARKPLWLATACGGDGHLELLAACGFC